MIVGIHHTALSTRDADRLVQFYREAFGFEVEFEFPWDEANEAFQQSHAVPESAGKTYHLCDPEPHTPGELVELFARAIGKRFAQVPVPLAVARAFNV